MLNESTTHTTSVSLATVDQAEEALLNYGADIQKTLERAIVLTQRAIALDENDGDVRAELKKIAKALRWAHLTATRLPQATHDLSTEAIAHGRGQS